MRNTLICTVGTSLFEANLKNLRSNADRNPASVPANWSALLGAYQTKNWITLVNELLKVDPSSRVCGAEINTVEEMRKQKWWSLENLYFLVSDTVEGENTGQVLKGYFAKRADLKLKEVDFTKIEKLQDTNPQEFKTHGLRNLVREIGKYLQRFGTEQVAIDATGGYKAQIAIAVVVGQALNVPVYYKHERFSEIIEFPPMPIALDYDILAENADILSDFERNQTFSATELGEMDDRLRVFLSEVPIDNEVHFELNAIGQIYLTGFRLRYLPRVKLEEAENRTLPTFGNDHHYPPGSKEFVNKVWQENSWITTIHSIPYGGQKGIKEIGFRVNHQGEERQLVATFKHDDFGAKFRIRLPDETNVKLALAADRLNQQYRP